MKNKKAMRAIEEGDGQEQPHAVQSCESKIEPFVMQNLQ